jgi:hypothetical protein
MAFPRAGSWWRRGRWRWRATETRMVRIWVRMRMGEGMRWRHWGCRRTTDSQTAEVTRKLL